METEALLRRLPRPRHAGQASVGHGAHLGPVLKQPYFWPNSSIPRINQEEVRKEPLCDKWDQLILVYFQQP